MKTFSFAPIQEDVRKQLTVTQEILEAIDDLNGVSNELSDAQKVEIQKAVKRLLGASDSLMSNVGRVSEFMREVSGNGS